MAEPPRSDASKSTVKTPLESAAISKPSAESFIETGIGPDSMLGEFRLLRKLGTGGMAQVYLAEQTTLRRQVAVKILRPEYVTDEQYVKRFRHEAAAAGSINHPNIVQVYMVGEQNGINYIAQEYVQGRTLKSYLNRKGPIDCRIALHILRQVASALQVAGENGIVHRDIKPENILLTNKCEAKVADFGLAQLTRQGERVSLTQSGVTMGTPLYMSPEQISGQALDARSDIYSFGIMAWHMFAGRPPFFAESAMAVALKHLNEKAPPLSDFREDVPAPVVDLIKRLMQKRKENRPADFGAVLAEIKQVIRQVIGKEDASLPLNPPRKQAFLFDRPFRQQIGWLLTACVVVLAASASIGWAMRAPDLKTIKSTGKAKIAEWQRIEPLLSYAETNPHDESAWISVKEFPDASNEIKGRARVALGLIYLKTNRRSLAETAFNELAMDQRLRADGLAGLAIIAQLKGQSAEAKELVAKVDALKVKLFPELDGAFKDLRQRLGMPK
jgi:eukaryotic-like serine/threonine-protein kinase